MYFQILFAVFFFVGVEMPKNVESELLELIALVLELDLACENSGKYYEVLASCGMAQDLFKMATAVPLRGGWYTVSARFRKLSVAIRKMLRSIEQGCDGDVVHGTVVFGRTDVKATALDKYRQFAAVYCGSYSLYDIVERAMSFRVLQPCSTPVIEQYSSWLRASSRPAEGGMCWLRTLLYEDGDTANLGPNPCVSTLLETYDVDRFTRVVPCGIGNWHVTKLAARSATFLGTVPAMDTIGGPGPGPGLVDKSMPIRDLREKRKFLAYELYACLGSSNTSMQQRIRHELAAVTAQLARSLGAHVAVGNSREGLGCSVGSSVDYPAGFRREFVDVSLMSPLTLRQLAGGVELKGITVLAPRDVCEYYNWIFHSATMVSFESVCTLTPRTKGLEVGQGDMRACAILYIPLAFAFEAELWLGVFNFHDHIVVLCEECETPGLLDAYAALMDKLPYK